MIFIFLIFSCKQTSPINLEKLKTIDNCYVSLGNNNKSKEFIINFPFIAFQLPNLNWRCTGSEPYCATFGNEDLEVTLCHRFNNLNLYYQNEICDQQNNYEENRFNNTQIDLSKKIQQELDNEVDLYSKRYSTPSKFELLPINWKDCGYLRTMDYGFIQKNGSARYFWRNFSATTYDEYFNIEFTSNSNVIDTKELQNEILFIIENLNGIPMHNK